MSDHHTEIQINRRQALISGAAMAGGLALPRLGMGNTAKPLIRGKVEHVICLWLAGGMGQIDTFDPKARGDAATKKPGAYYDAIDTVVPGVKVCEHLPQIATMMDRVTAVRSLYHDVIDEHAAATNRMHTGRPVSGTVTYPSIGSIIAHERGAAAAGVPPYVLIGYPNVTRGPGFLGARAGYLYLTNTNEGPAGLSLPPEVTPERQKRRESLRAALQKSHGPNTNPMLEDYDAAIRQSVDLSSPEFNRVFQLDLEPASLRNRYGSEFGQRCLLSRRLIERGVRYIEVAHNLNFLNGAGWDVHTKSILNQHLLIQELDTAMSALLADLEEKKLLDKTLVTVMTEFGRPPEFDSGGGRGHQGRAFTCVLAGGGLNHCGAYGETDELSKKVTANPVSVPDFFATILASLGIDYRKNLYDGDRPIPITDQGEPIAALFG